MAVARMPMLSLGVIFWTVPVFLTPPPRWGVFWWGSSLGDTCKLHRWGRDLQHMASDVMWMAGSWMLLLSLGVIFWTALVFPTPPRLGRVLGGEQFG